MAYSPMWSRASHDLAANGEIWPLRANTTFTLCSMLPEGSRSAAACHWARYPNLRVFILTLLPLTALQAVLETSKNDRRARKREAPVLKLSAGLDYDQRRRCGSKSLILFMCRRLRWSRTESNY
jgi:hypothetical protein